MLKDEFRAICGTICVLSIVNIKYVLDTLIMRSFRSLSYCYYKIC